MTQIIDQSKLLTERIGYPDSAFDAFTDLILMR